MVDPEIALIEALYARADARAAEERLEIDQLYARGDNYIARSKMQPSQSNRIRSNKEAAKRSTSLAHDVATPDVNWVFAFAQGDVSLDHRQSNGKQGSKKKAWQAGEKAGAGTQSLPLPSLSQATRSHSHL